MSMTISCTWAGQCTDQTTLDIIRSVYMSVVYNCRFGLFKSGCRILNRDNPPIDQMLYSIRIQKCNLSWT